MQYEHLIFLVCPECKGDLTLLKMERGEHNRIKSGILRCSGCEMDYQITNYIPRFVASDNYASYFFGWERTKHPRTQHDSYAGKNVSETRFFVETKWGRDLKDQLILEVGSGSGRFTEQAALTGAVVISMDYSYAVDANYAFNGGKNNVFIVQADVYKMPFRENFFEKLFCFGVL